MGISKTLLLIASTFLFSKGEGIVKFLEMPVIC
jgi:hypothetical protein